MYFIYMILCLDNTIYTGITNNMQKRMNQHLNQTGAKYTRHRGIKHIEAVWVTSNRSVASQVEYAIKQKTRQQKDRLIAQPSLLEWEDVYYVGHYALNECTIIDNHGCLVYNKDKIIKGDEGMQSRLKQLFIDLVSIDSVSRHEGDIALHLKDVMTKLGLEVIEDNSKETTGLGSNNLIGVLKGTVEGSLLFSCHTDTVTPGNGVEVVEKDGVLYSKGDTILAADDKAGIAILLEAIHQIKEQQLPTKTLEFVFSPGEEIGLVGASALDMSMIQSDMGYVLDMGGPVGHVTVGSPSMYMYDVVLHGKPAHAGLEPEKGISCVSMMQEALSKLSFGRIDEETTANIGVIHGGEATNIVMDHMMIKGEVRSISDKKAQALVAQVEQAFNEAALKHGGQVEFTKDKKATGFKIENDQPVMQRLINATKAIGLECVTEVSGGGSDANVFNAAGKHVVNLSIGYDKIHTTEEHIALKDMEQAVSLVLELVK